MAIQQVREQSQRSIRFANPSPVRMSGSRDGPGHRASRPTAHLAWSGHVNAGESQHQASRTLGDWVRSIPRSCPQPLLLQEFPHQSIGFVRKPSDTFCYSFALGLCREPVATANPGAQRIRSPHPVDDWLRLTSITTDRSSLSLYQQRSSDSLTLASFGTVPKYSFLALTKCRACATY